LDYERLLNWLERYGLPQYHAHVSGHIMPMHLKAILRELNAKEIFPVHTEKPNLFAGFMRDLKGKIAITEKDREYKI
ncbi:MAG: hypothetical protein QXM86_03845, partial [Candidatus Bathyarchaeia archaeon]